MFLVSCSGSDSPTPPKEPDLKEIPTTEAALSGDASEIELMFRGKRYFESRVFGEAKKAFQSITSNFPLGPYAEFAAVKHADTIFELQDYGAAAAMYEELYKNHPGAEYAPYALFRAARSYQLAQRGVGRDDSTLQKAAKLYDDLIQKYPDSFYAGAGKTYREESHRNLAEYEDEVAAFYRKRNKLQAAEARERAYQEKWQPLLVAGASQEQIAKPSEQRAALERIAAEVDAAPQPSLTQPLISPSSRKTEASPLPQTQVGAAAVRTAARTAGHFVSKIECATSEDTQIALFVDREFTDESQLQIQKLSDTKVGTYTIIKLLDTAAQPVSTLCSDGSRASISADGELRIESSKEVSLMTLGNPPRVLVALQ